MSTYQNQYLLTQIIVFQTKNRKTNAITFNERTPENEDDERATSTEIGDTIRYVLCSMYLCTTIK